MIREYFYRTPNAFPKLIVLMLLYVLFLGLHVQTTTSSDLTSPQKQPAITATQIEANVATTETPGCKISDSFSDPVKHWEKDICRWSQEHQMDPDLIATIMQIESCGNPNAVSATGVRGLFQVTGANLDGQDPFNPDVSMAKGPAKVLKSELQAANNNVTAAMAGYNGGPWARQWINGEISSGTFAGRLRNHPSGYWRTSAKANAKLNEVKWYAQWANIYYESKNNQKDTLQKWLDMGGNHLCNQATAQLNLPTTPVLAGAEAEKNNFK